MPEAVCKLPHKQIVLRLSVTLELTRPVSRHYVRIAGGVQSAKLLIESLENQVKHHQNALGNITNITYFTSNEMFSSEFLKSKYFVET